MPTDIRGRGGADQSSPHQLLGASCSGFPTLSAPHSSSFRQAPQSPHQYPQSRLPVVFSKSQERSANMGGVDQPLLSIATPAARNNGAINQEASCAAEPTTPPLQTRRFLDRSGRFNQSLGTFNLKRIGGDWRRIYWDDPFHTIINTRTSRIITGIFVAYFFVILFFAMAYLDISNRRTECHLGLVSLMDSYIFSLETIMTIGYGAPTDDIFYGGCTSMAMLLTLESFAGIFLDSICIGIFYARLSRANARANTIMFSQLGVIRKIRGHYYLMLQVCERRKHQLVEAHVRLYAVRHEVSNDELPDSLFQCQQMRIQQPDDDSGAMLLMVLPQVIVHRIDQWSPLFPRECLPDSGHFPAACPAYPDPSQRQVDVDNGSRDGLPAASGGATQQPFKEPTKAQIMKHMRQSEVEVIVILEGIDSLTSNTMQARHSYTHEEFAWDATFERCVVKGSQGLCIDFDRFHVLRPAPPDADKCVMACQY